ncbi:14055_t:CDS:2 [Entrophospora sp. SA101]|nr:14055_t:CDS:2 [Entrophospora sp. SA101]
MSKRKVDKTVIETNPDQMDQMDITEDEKVAEEDGNEQEENSDNSDNEISEGEEIINVDFDFFDPKDSDFHSIKTLLKQLFSSDSELFELSELTELIVNQPSVGTTVKVDGSDSDPFAFLTRLINMPVEIIPPLYKMLQEEIEDAIEDNKPFEFEWFLIITKVYKEVESMTDKELEEEQQIGKRKKTKLNSDYQLNFKLTKKPSESDSKRSFYDFGILPSLKIFLLHKNKFKKLVTDLEIACNNN